MKKITIRFIILFIIVALFTSQLNAQTATITINPDITYQKITGFGGFVNSPQFGYNHMTPAQIRQLWGKDSDMGYNIMRLFIPVGENNWPQALATAQLAQSLDIIIFASPWTMPPEWKTNNHINAIHNGVVGYLKEEHYEDYANYLNNFVVYMRENGVELAAISVQNEPDYTPEYHGCRWTPAQMARFIKDYGHIITAPIMAAEGVGITDNYANAMLPDEVFDNLGVFAGHQYGPIQTAHKKLQEKGMEVWQSEFLINWNANRTPRNFDWSIDAFDFAKAVNDALLSDINAWVHYASKRYYGMMGDGLHGTVNGAITKRGYILSHYAKYTTGTTRIDHFWKDASGVLDGTAYLSVTGDSVIVKVINSSNNPYNLAVDLPFFTDWGKSITTTSDADMTETILNISEETFRPRVEIAASSFTTLIFTRGEDRPVSEMQGEPVYYNSIENQQVTNEAFGTNYLMSGNTFTFDNSRALISSFTNANNGYLALDDRFNKMVLHVKEISSTQSFSSANTTLYYINRNGAVRSHNYGSVNFNPNGNFNWVLDISPKVLPEGIIGVIGIRNGNWSSVLTITFGDVYFLLGDEKQYKFSGVYSPWDGDLLDGLEDPAYTSIDFTEVDGITSDMDWNAVAANPNCLFYIGEDVVNDNPNIIRDGQSSQLVLSGQEGNFYAPQGFFANTASYTRDFNGYELMILPFDAQIPSEEVRVYTLEYSSNQVNGTRVIDEIIPAHTPVLVYATGTITFTGSGEVSTPPYLTVNDFNGVYVSVLAPTNSYVYKGGTTFHRVTSGSETTVLPFSAYLDLGSSVVLSNLPIVLDDAVITNINPVLIDQRHLDGNVIYDLLGRPVNIPQKGVIYIKNGKKIILF